MASGIAERYLAGDARAFFPSYFRERADRERAVRDALRPLAPDVAAALEAQNAAYGPSPARAANLAALRGGAAAVVTGQQVGLLLGPLYTVYKAASAVAVARALREEMGAPVVPVFWLQTEDHDLAEVAECHLLRADCEPIRLALPAPDTRVSLAHVALPPELQQCLALLRAELGGLPRADEHLNRIERHYRPGVGYARAFAGVLAELFAEDGLVLVDPRTPELSKAAAEVHRRALTHASGIADALCARSAALHDAGCTAPVHVRPGAPLFFFHPEHCDGPRYRLQAEADGRFSEVGGTGRHNAGELLAILERDPLRFSTSALLRPILQDSLLPTAAYVGGPGEIAYFAQLAPLYAAFELPMPVIVPRARFVVIEPKSERLLSRYSLARADAQLPLEKLLTHCRTGQDRELSAAELEQRLSFAVRRAMADVIGALPELGAELRAAEEKTHAAIDKALSKFSHKYESASLHRNAAVLGDLRRLKALLHPSDQPQERVLGLPYFAARYGERAFLDQVNAALDPWDSREKELRP